MRNFGLVAALALSLAAGSAVAQTAATTSAAAVSAIEAGAYKVDTNHTQVIWAVDHLGLSRLQGMVGGMSGVLQLDPAQPQAAKLDIEIPVSGLTVTSAAFAQHLKTPDLFDTTKFPTAKFTATSVTPKGHAATIVGDLTLHGVTKPVTLEARFYGAGANPMSKAKTVGFSATGKLKRSDFGLGFAAPAVSDEVSLEINAAFEKTAAQ